jgi:hypothetical protein
VVPISILFNIGLSQEWMLQTHKPNFLVSLHTKFSYFAYFTSTKKYSLLFLVCFGVCFLLSFLDEILGLSLKRIWAEITRGPTL